MTVLDNVKTALHNHVEYSLAESFFHLGAYHKKEKAMDEKAIEILKVFDLDGQADVLASNLPYGKPEKTGNCPCAGNGTEASASG